MQLRLFLSAIAVAPFLAVAAFAQDASQAPLVGGSPDVSVGGAAAARQGDATKDGSPVVQGSPNVFINGRPAATAGGKTACGGAVTGGAPNVFINGKPLARAGDATAGCAPK